MTLAIFLAVTFGAAGGALVLGRRPLASSVVGVAGLALALLTALLLDPAEHVTVGGALVATSAYLRLFLVLGSAVGLVLVVVGLATRSRRDAPAVTLGTLGAAALAMSLADPRIAVLGDHGGRPARGPPDPRPRREPGGRHDRHARAAGAHGRGRDGDRRHGLDRPRPQPAGRPASRLRPRLPRVRPGRGHPLRRHPVPHLGGAPHRHGPRGRPADRHRLGSGRLRRRGPRLDRRLGRAAPRRDGRRTGDRPRVSR